jgi:hypothetical protein
MRRTPLGFEKEEKEHLQQLLEGIIESSSSECVSPPVLVRKKDIKLTYCIYFRKLHNVTVKDAYPIPNIKTSLDTIIGAAFISTLYMASGYYRVQLDEQDKHKTAFVTQYGFTCTRNYRLIQLALQGLA